MKGHAIIELKDVVTGKTEIHEDDNLVTNALSWLLNKTGGVLHNNPLADAIGNNDDDLVKACTGGIYLFKEPLEEDVDTLYAPNDAELVGCGSGISYSGNSPFPGSYNAIESGYSEDKLSYKHVWDFSTSQANGQISCVCLTTQAGGKVTTGVPEYHSDYVIDNEKTFVSGSGYLYISNHQNNMYYVDIENKRIIVYGGKTTENNTAYINLNIFRLNLTNDISLFDFLRDNVNEAYDLMETIKLAIPEKYRQITGSTEMKFTGADHIYLVKATSSIVNPGGKIIIWKIHAKTFENQTIEFTNPLSTNIMLSNGIPAFAENYAFFKSFDGRIYRFNISNNADYSAIKNSDGTDFVLTGNDNLHPFYFNGKLYASFSYSGNDYEKILPLETDVIKYRNRKLSNYNIGCGDFYLSSYGTSVLQMVIDPCILVTINNLQTPVTKTASQTMKITYTIEFGD